MTIRTLLVAFCLLFFASGHSQSYAKTKTKDHVLIEGTNIFMIPPEAFEASTNFKGFQNPADPTSMVMTIEIPGPYLEVKDGFNLQKLEEAGMELTSQKEIKIAGYDGMLIEVDQSTNGMIFSKHILVYGNENSTTMINGVFIKDSTQVGMDIKKSIHSTIVDTDLKSNPREALTYTVDESVGNLKFNSTIGNGMLFNRDLKTPTESLDKATLVTDKSYAKTEIENKKLFCISRVKKYPEDYSVVTSKGINEIIIDKLEGFELIATNNENENEEMYQVVLFANDGGYYLFFGTYQAGHEEALKDIKEVIKTFSRKNKL